MNIDLVIVKKMADLTYSLISSIILGIMDSYRLLMSVSYEQ
jgi:hypothetical protein